PLHRASRRTAAERPPGPRAAGRPGGAGDSAGHADTQVRPGFRAASRATPPLLDRSKPGPAGRVDGWGASTRDAWAGFLCRLIAAHGRGARAEGHHLTSWNPGAGAHGVADRSANPRAEHDHHAVKTASRTIRTACRRLKTTAGTVPPWHLGQLPWPAHASGSVACRRQRGGHSTPCPPPAQVRRSKPWLPL